MAVGNPAALVGGECRRSSLSTRSCSRYLPLCLSEPTNSGQVFGLKARDNGTLERISRFFKTLKDWKLRRVIQQIQGDCVIGKPNPR